MDGSGVDIFRRRYPPRELSSPPIHDELLLDVFRRIHSPADLVRASAACVSFRRLVADRSFLRQYRKLHGPPLLGFLDAGRNFHPAGPPHPSAPAASAVALAADFSFDFLPAAASRWIVEDIRGGRVLLGRSLFRLDIVDNLMEIVVCDPLHRLYVLLPPVPRKLFRELGFTRKIFLVPPVSSVDKEEETAFRVIWMARRLWGDKLVAIVFSSSTGQWQDGPSHSWSSSFDGLLNFTGEPNFSGPRYVYGCFYWVTDCREHLLVLDTQRMEFSLTVAPPEAKGSADVVDIAIVEAGEGRAGIFVRPEYTNDLNYSIRQNNCVSSSQWLFERTVSLDFKFSLMGSAGRHLYLFKRQSLSLDGAYFSLDVKTFQLQRVFVSNSYMPYGCTYSSFPPSLLSTPTISNGVQEEVEKEIMEQGASSSAESPRLSD